MIWRVASQLNDRDPPRFRFREWLEKEELRKSLDRERCAREMSGPYRTFDKDMDKEWLDDLMEGWHLGDGRGTTDGPTRVAQFKLNKQK